jgi:MoaA/NifB/PqqE/SkfB family radical SAM enzyme
MIRKNLLDRLLNKKVLIWGARMTGIGALRQLKTKNINVIGFIDSDLAFDNKFVHGLPVLNNSSLVDVISKNYDLAIVVAVSLKEDEITHQLNNMNIQNYENIEIFSFLDNEAPYYTVDILGSCNLNCPSCPHSILDTEVPKGSMKLDTFKEVFDKIIKDSPNVSHLSLYSWGEPLLHPYISDIIDYVHDKNVAVALSSNLSIKFGERIKKIIKSKPDYLKISLSGFYPKAYDNTHTGGDIDLVKKNLKLIKNYIDQFGSEILVDINYHLYRDNSGENLYKMEELTNDLGFILSKTHALVMPLERVMSHLDGNTDNQTSELQKNLLVTIEEGIEASSKIKLKDSSCPFRENQVNINSDLSVPVCCTVWERGSNVVAKNFLKSNVDEINNKKKQVELCIKCMKNNLPQYNMGFNQKLWKKYAKDKILNDVGSK